MTSYDLVNISSDKGLVHVTKLLVWTNIDILRISSGVNLRVIYKEMLKRVPTKMRLRSTHSKIQYHIPGAYSYCL